MKYAEGTLKDALERTADFIREKESRTDPGDTYCLCHGNCGNAALHYRIQSEKGIEFMERTVASLREAEEIRNCLGIQECGNMGLMGGVTGIGYGCLCGAKKCAEILEVGISDII